jgi:hypothetical protein
MPSLFGIDIAKTIADNIAAAGDVRSGTLTKSSAGARTPGDVTAGNNPTTSTHSFKGFVETRAQRREGSQVPEGMGVVTILGATVSPAAVPAVNDVATIDGDSYTLLKLISRDPAAAVYEFMVED